MQRHHYVSHVGLDTRLPLVFQRATLEKLGGAWGRGSTQRVMDRYRQHFVYESKQTCTYT